MMMNNCNYLNCPFCSKVDINYWDTDLFDRWTYSHNSIQGLHLLLDQYYGRQGIRFGNLIHTCKPNSYGDWVRFVDKHNKFLPSKDIMDSIEATPKQKAYWFTFRKQLLYFQLYLPEVKAIEVLSKHFNDQFKINWSSSLDAKYGIDVIGFNPKTNKYVLVAVKWKLDERLDNFCIIMNWYKFSYDHYNLDNTELYIWDYWTSRLYQYSTKSDNCYQVYKPSSEVYEQYWKQLCNEQQEYAKFRLNKNKAVVEDLDAHWIAHQEARELHFARTRAKHDECSKLLMKDYKEMLNRASDDNISKWLTLLHSFKGSK